MFFDPMIGYDIPEYKDIILCHDCAHGLFGYMNFNDKELHYHDEDDSATTTGTGPGDS
jgi:hypothetical protein